MNPLQGRHRWLTNRSSVAVALGLTLAVSYAVAALELPPGTRFSFAAVLLSVCVLAQVTGDRVEQNRLGTLRKLAEGTAARDVHHLLQAAHEVAGLPDLTFVVVFSLFAAGSLVTGAVWSLISRAPFELTSRVALLGVCVAPLTASIALLLTQQRSRQLLGELVHLGLAPQQLYKELSKPFVSRGRLMAFAAISVGTPLILLADLSLSRLWRLLHASRLAADQAALAQIIADHRSASVAPGLVLLGVSLVIVATCAYLAGQSLGAPLIALAAETEAMATGKAHTPAFIASEYETLAAAAALTRVEHELLSVMHRLGLTARELADSSDALGGTPHLTAEGHGEALDALSITTSELARSAKDIAANAHRVSELAGRTLQASRIGRASAEGFLGAMSEVRAGNQDIADSVVRLNKRVQQVGRIVEFINGIADRSDLLALNAELEGHKAGEVGRGFSLVAAEMRRLAESVIESTKEIARLIDDTRDATNAAVMATEAGVKATDAGAGFAQRVGEGLGRIVQYANQSSEAMQSISLATAQQQVGTDQLVAAMREIVRSSEETDRATSSMGAAHQALDALAKRLADAVRSFEGQRS